MAFFSFLSENGEIYMAANLYVLLYKWCVKCVGYDYSFAIRKIQNGKS